MELGKTVEALTKDVVGVAKFIGERAIHGAWGTLANVVHAPQPTEENIERGSE